MGPAPFPSFCVETRLEVLPPSHGRKYLADGELRCKADRPLPHAELARLADALAALNAQHDWWAEQLTFEPVGEDGLVEGHANLTLVGYEAPDGDLVDVEAGDDAFMAWMDLCVAVDWLRGQSQALGIGWSLRYGGEEIGRIAEGQEDEDLEAFLVLLGEVVGAAFDERDDERAIALDEAYSDRE
jgi:hypothetical protein